MDVIQSISLNGKCNESIQQYCHSRDQGYIEKHESHAAVHAVATLEDQDMETGKIASQSRSGEHSRMIQKKSLTNSHEKIISVVKFFHTSMD